jgi:hypothetical protein
MPNIRKNKKNTRKIWKGSGGPDDTDTTKSSTGDSSRSSTPYIFSTNRNALISSDTPLNPPTILKPNSNDNISAPNKRNLINNNNDDDKRHKINFNNATMEKRRVDVRNQNRNNLNPKGQHFDHTGNFEFSDDEFIHSNYSSHAAVKALLDQRNAHDKRGGKSRRKSKKSKKRTRKTKRKSRR